MMAFATHISYGLTTNPISWRVVEYSSYHKIADCTHPYRALSPTFCCFSIVTNSFRLGSISQKRSTSLPVIFIITMSFILAFKYAPFISVTATALSSTASMILVRKKPLLIPWGTLSPPWYTDLVASSFGDWILIGVAPVYFFFYKINHSCRSLSLFSSCAFLPWKVSYSSSF